MASFLRWALIAIVALGATPALARPCGADIPAARRVHPVLTGAAGPFARTTLTLIDASREHGDTPGRFAGVLAIGGGQCLDLPATDEPEDLYMLAVKAVLFTPLDRGRRGNGIVVLYDSSRIGPGHGTDKMALAYRITAQGARRDRAIEARLEGARQAAEVRRRLAR